MDLWQKVILIQEQHVCLHFRHRNLVSTRRAAWKKDDCRASAASGCFVVAMQVPALCWRLSREAFTGKALELGGPASAGVSPLTLELAQSM